MDKTAIFYGSSGGATGIIAEKIAVKLGSDVDLFDVANTKAAKVGEYTNLILGSSTWGIGDLQDDWEDFLPDLSNEDLQGKTIALFGLGDGQCYPDSFVDAMGMIYKELQDKGCTFIGHVETDEYNFDDSKAIYNGRFVGLVIDEDNESDLSESRIVNWLDKIKSELS